VHLAPPIKCQGCQGLPRRTEPLLSGQGPCGSDAQVDTTAAAGRVGRAAACRGRAHGPRGSRQAVAVGDIDGDGELEVVFGTSAGGVHALRGPSGLDAPGFPFRTRGRIMAPVLLAPLVAGEPGLRLVVQSHDGHLYAISGASGAPQRFPLALRAARARGGCGPYVPLAMHQKA